MERDAAGGERPSDAAEAEEHPGKGAQQRRGGAAEVWPRHVEITASCRCFVGGLGRTVSGDVHGLSVDAAAGGRCSRSVAARQVTDALCSFFVSGSTHHQTPATKRRESKPATSSSTLRLSSRQRGAWRKWWVGGATEAIVGDSNLNASLCWREAPAEPFSFGGCSRRRQKESDRAAGWLAGGSGAPAGQQ